MSPFAANAAETKSFESAFDFSFPAIDGSQIDLQDYAGKVLLVVNTASQCGFTPQYEGLQTLHETYHDKGLIVIGVPSNDFGKQEKGTRQDIAEFCEVNFGIQFLMTDKMTVKGDEAHPFYQWAKAQTGFAGRPRWNFHKYLIGSDGQIIDWFSSMTAPDSEKLQQAIKDAL